MNATPAGLHVYRALTMLLGPLAGPALHLRVRSGKEDGARLGERFGHASRQRPDGALLWLHGASVGETRVLLSLQAALRVQRPDLNWLFTSGTRTSASLFGNPPPRTIHQYTPLDRPDVAHRFIAHWRPDAGVFAEGEIWPNLIEAAAEGGVPLALVNARMSERSLKRWRGTPQFAARIFGRFAAILAADARTAAGVSEILGRPITSPGNLKRAAPAPTSDPATLATLRAAIQGRKVWLAASTHPGEDEIALAAHEILRKQTPDALLILAPRHPERGAAVAALAGEAPRRSAGSLPGPAPCYVADTMGELVVFYALAPVALVGGSLLPTLRGHNPVEPAQLGCDVVSGPHVDSFADLYADLRDAGACRFVHNADELAATVTSVWADPASAAARVASARRLLADGAQAMAATLDALCALLPPVRHAAA